VWLQSWGVNSLNADMLMTAEFHSKRGRDLYHYHNPELDGLIDQGRAELNDAAAKATYARVQAILWRDLPWVPLYVQPDSVAYNTNLTGWYRTNGDDYIRFWYAYFK
jgi:peptide/nickel transport system substrate-binding protein